LKALGLWGALEALDDVHGPHAFLSPHAGLIAFGELDARHLRGFAFSDRSSTA
jgi:hypothetical protein